MQLLIDAVKICTYKAPEIPHNWFAVIYMTFDELANRPVIRAAIKFCERCVFINSQLRVFRERHIDCFLQKLENQLTVKNVLQTDLIFVLFSSRFKK